MPVVNIQMFSGRSDEAKQKIAKDITDSIVKNGEVDPKYVYVLFSDVDTNNWAIAGEVYSETVRKQTD